MRLGYLLKKITSIDYGKMVRIAKEIHRETGKSTFSILKDMTKCGITYQAGPTDYRQAEMYLLSPYQREDIITSGVSVGYTRSFCDSNYYYLLDDKSEMYNHFKKYLHRDYSVIRSEEDKDTFMEFISGRDTVIIKPVEESGGGRGVKKFLSADKEEAWTYALSLAPALVEDLLIQCEEMASLNPSSINTIRPLTFYKDGKITFLAIYLRVGQGGLVDNFCDGGMVSPIDIETGEVIFPAADENNRYYETHPITGVTLPGFKIPYFDEMKKMVTEAALTIPQLRFVGWDIAITPDGPCIIEGNLYPSHAFFNFSKHHPDGVYLRRKFESVMNG